MTSIGAQAPVPHFVQPSPADMLAAARILASQQVTAAFAACEWDEIHDDGKVWIAAIVRETLVDASRQPRSIPSDLIVEVFGFVVEMAKHFRRRTSRWVLGIRFNTMSRTQAMDHAFATYDATLDMIGVPFGDPSLAWDRDTAHSFVDEELQHWEA